MKAAYDLIGKGYSKFRTTDPDIAAALGVALGDAVSVLNVGAGAGSYEGCAPVCISVEPSAAMISQRSAHAAPVVQGAAERLPLPTGSFDAAMAILTVHHWSDLEAGLNELKRVANRLVVLTFDAAVHDNFWLFTEYVPEATKHKSQRPPTPQEIGTRLGNARIEVVPVPAHCRDGFTLAYWKRPDAYLDPQVRNCCSSFAELPTSLVEERMVQLAADLESGRWGRSHSRLLDATSYDGGLRLVVTE